MTSGAVPEVFRKPMGSFLKEANAIEKHDPVMAFHCAFRV